MSGGSKYTCVGYKRIIESGKIINSAILKDDQRRIVEVLIREVEKI